MKKYEESSVEKTGAIIPMSLSIKLELGVFLLEKNSFI